MHLFSFIVVLGFLSAGIALAASSEERSQPTFILKTDRGEITLQLDEKKAPKTVENFRRYVSEGHYNGTIFHRVIPGFMVQAGGFTPDMSQKPTHEPIQNEANASGLTNKRGTIAMARTSDVNSATAQFFINVVDNPSLNYKSPRDYGYAVFGEVIKGMDVVDAIVNVPTGSKNGHQNVPKTAVVIQEVVEVK